MRAPDNNIKASLLDSGYNQAMNYLVIVPLILGWLSGWLVNYLADVLPLTRKFTRPTCPACQTKFAWSDYLPFRKCTNCGKRRTLRTFFVQGLMVVAAVWIWIFQGRALPFPLGIILLIYLAVVFIIDLEHRVVLHPVSIIGAVLSLGIGIFLRSGQSLTYGITSTLLGGITGFGIMLVFYFLGELFVKRMAKKGGLASDEVALGFGDVSLSGILGLLLGWQLIFVCLFFAILVGGVVSLVVIVGMLIAKKYKAFTAIPYAPFLILSAVYFLFR
ncbi:MAG: prepilin peptidase [Anaerolineales bacterium]|jgi:leader peptidase (prepilin peptidase)/N-methyltransferase